MKELIAITNRELCKKYPFLLPYEALAEQDIFETKTDRVNPDFVYDYTMMDFVPKGWEELFLQMCEELREALLETGELYQFRFVEVKEKYGELRIYTSGGSKMADDIVREYEKRSGRVCVECGKPATRISKGWICPYCDDCIGGRSYYSPEET
mgnify:CR=1 FL=1